MLDEGRDSTTTPRAIRILALGDCNTNSNDARQGLVPVELAELLMQAGRHVELTNQGFGMATCREGRLQIGQHHGPAELLMLNYGLVDAWHTTLPGLYLPYFRENRLKKYVRKLLKLTKRRLRSPLVRRFIPTGPVVPPEEYRDNLNAIMDVFRQHNEGGVVVLWSTPFVAGNEERNQSLAHYNDIIRGLAVGSDVIFVDSNQALQEMPMPSRFIDSVHLSIPAARLLGNAILAKLPQSCLQKPPGTDERAAEVRGAA